MMGEVAKTATDVLCECVDCNGTFIMTIQEVDYYTSHNLRVPRRCKKCRTKKKKLDFLENMEIRALIEGIRDQEEEFNKLLIPVTRSVIIQAFENMSKANKQLLYHNWQLIRKAYIEQNISLAGKLPNSWKLLELYVYDRDAYLMTRQTKQEAING